MRIFTKFLSIALFICLYSVCNAQLLRVQDPRAGFRSGTGQIDSAAILVRPKGVYTEVAMYMTYSSKGTFLTSNKDTLEVQHYFNLPKDVLVSDSWLWFQDFIIRAKLIDRWTASTIYNQIVGLRQDPSILLKNSQTNYEYRIYPMVGNQTRRVRLAFLVPTRWQGNQAYIDLPINILMTSSTLPKLNIRVVEQELWKNPRLAELPNFKFAIQTDTLGQTLGGIVDLTAFRTTQKLRIAYDSPAKNGIFVATQPINNNEGYYQLMVMPHEVANLNTTKRKILAAVDYNSSNTYLLPADIMAQLRENLRNTLTPKDSFNLIFSRLLPTPLSNSWFPATKLDSVFTALGSNPLSNISNLPTLLAKSVEYLKANNGGKLLLISSDASITSSNSANELIAELKKINNTLPQMHLLDISTATHTWYTVGSVWYMGNGYLYTNLARQSGGNYIDMVNSNDIGDFTSRIFQNLNGSFDNLDLYTTLEDGYCHSRYNIDDGNHIYGSPLVQIGKYRGKMPMRIDLSGTYGGTDFSRKWSIPEIDLVASDVTLPNFWTGQQIYKLENNTVSDNLTIQQIIDMSMSSRILSRYTAFLALEPAQGGDTCRTCDNKSTSVTATKDIANNGVKMSATPNPFRSNTALKINFEAWQTTSKARIAIYDMTGKIVKSFDITIKQGDTEVQVDWEAADMPSGVYVVRFVSDNLQKTIKIVKME
jgi:Secretion system C-terminal sorting domain